eukprot:CAMPEP_0201983964 /NCGR_PEP_ID=MMETSP0904-20121228/82086_1 /ASSEMBLY_ACC=CAM_ASM_000553 /TAXON_ID=420261 /ORGANISM="Thalassiosira antarctica, Strain CCMP982" /LENGTH=285 /DNA_ID=CAMNT_0048537227 /DNA_START=24 /DNA_END=878 /DNA_ORIENTATION=-
MFKGDYEGGDELVAGLMNEGQDTTAEPVRWAKNPKKKRRPKPTKMKAKREERWPTTSSPTVVVDQDFPTLASTSTTPMVTTEEPTTFAPTSAMATTEPITSAPSTEEIFSWSETAAPKTMATICPPHYITSTTYTVGDTIEAHSQIYQCQSIYCNIWVHVGACEKVFVEEEEEVEARDDAVVGGVTEAHIAIATTTAATTTMVTTTTEAPITPETAQLPPCPTDYDTTKTTYIAGEHVTVKSHIFKCSEEVGYDIYCNIAIWDDSLLAQNENAKELWTNAWEEVG